ncbi:hypothetical protein Pen02_53950 [Plantactinospora endophytica]|uniref:Uncharacterized protein n=1 Tax=Plantactinospora endophytica TaxID=673535 RepID=A0ABQ4E6W5_9ACTN|nr:hypothetical protein Pen02_53950 [Plantactinospora endophytica]
MDPVGEDPHGYRREGSDAGGGGGQQTELGVADPQVGLELRGGGADRAGVGRVEREDRAEQQDDAQASPAAEDPTAPGA